jgi:hypothetical protein
MCISYFGKFTSFPFLVSEKAVKETIQIYFLDFHIKTEALTM